MLHPATSTQIPKKQSKLQSDIAETSVRSDNSLGNTPGKYSEDVLLCCYTNLSDITYTYKSITLTVFTNKVQVKMVRQN